MLRCAWVGGVWRVCGLSEWGGIGLTPDKGVDALCQPENDKSLGSRLLSNSDMYYHILYYGINRSSSDFPSTKHCSTHTGRLPRPVQVFSGLAGF